MQFHMHLHYQNLVPNGQTNLLPWDVTQDLSTGRLFTNGAARFFTNAADRLLRSSLDLVVLTNGSLRSTNFMLGLTSAQTTLGAVGRLTGAAVRK